MRFLFIVVGLVFCVVRKNHYLNGKGFFETITTVTPANSETRVENLHT